MTLFVDSLRVGVLIRYRLYRIAQYRALPALWYALRLSAALPWQLWQGSACLDVSERIRIGSETRGISEEKWRARQDSNLRPLAPEANASAQNP